MRNYQQSKLHQRRQFFNQNYRQVWGQPDILSELECQLLDLSFGLSGEVYSNRELAKKFHLKNQQQVNRKIHCALNKLRKAREIQRQSKPN